MGSDRRLGVARAWHFLSNRKASPLAKLFLLFAVLYVIMPFDLVPDVAVVIGWIDDLAVITAAVTALLFSMRRPSEPARPAVVETTGVTIKG